MHVMVDLENVGEALLSIGAVLIDGGGEIRGAMDVAVDLQSCIDSGLRVSGSAFYWWLKQSRAARGDLDRGVNLPLSAALQQLREFIPDGALLWGNGAASDNAQLSRACEAVGVPRLVSYQNDRCYRTVRAQHPDVVAPGGGDLAHCAYDDALYQAEHLIAIAAVYPEVLR